MNEAKKQKIIGELEDFYKELKSYERYLDPNRVLLDTQKRYRNSLRESLVRRSGRLKPIIIKLTKKQYITRAGITWDMWDMGLDPYPSLPENEVSLARCIDATNEAIGKLESTPLAELKLQEVSVTQKPKDTTELPVYLFDAMQFHPKVVEASRSLFETEHYAQAIFEAFKAVENFVQDKSGLTLYGTNLMETVFNEENPIIKVPEAGYYYKDVQRGFKHLFIGAAQGIRNPKAHKEIIQKDPYITLQYLGFASFLLKRIDYWEAGVS